MNQRTIAAIALSMRDFPSFPAKLTEAARWLEFAAGQGAQMAVLPETINMWHGDGPGNPKPLKMRDAALDDWKQQTAPLIDAARQLHIALALPLLVRENGLLWNSTFYFSSAGELVGRYDKVNPTIGELQLGIQPGIPRIFTWEGLRVGSAICFDTNFPELFDQQAAQSAQLFIIPSLWPGGRQLNYFAARHHIPIVVAYPAWSRIINYDGLELAAGGERWETLRFGFGAPVFIATLNFDYAVINADYNQEKIVAVQQKYGSQVRIRFDQDDTMFYLESLAPNLTAAQIVQECNLELAHDYEARYRKFRAQYSSRPSTPLPTNNI